MPKESTVQLLGQTLSTAETVTAFLLGVALLCGALAVWTYAHSARKANGARLRYTASYGVAAVVGIIAVIGLIAIHSAGYNAGMELAGYSPTLRGAAAATPNAFIWCVGVLLPAALTLGFVQVHCDKRWEKQ